VGGRSSRGEASYHGGGKKKRNIRPDGLASREFPVRGVIQKSKVLLSSRTVKLRRTLKSIKVSLGFRECWGIA